MKTFLSSSMVVLLLLGANGIQAQTTQTKLDQMELMKQFLGIWKGELKKDTIMIMNFTSYGKAFEDNLKIFTKGKILSSAKEIYGYNPKYDKIVVAALGEILHRLLFMLLGSVQRTQGILSDINIWLILRNLLLKSSGF